MKYNVYITKHGAFNLCRKFQDNKLSGGGEKIFLKGDV